MREPRALHSACSVLCAARGRSIKCNTDKINCHFFAFGSATNENVRQTTTTTTRNKKKSQEKWAAKEICAG